MYSKNTRIGCEKLKEVFRDDKLVQVDDLESEGESFVGLLIDVNSISLSRLQEILTKVVEIFPSEKNADVVETGKAKLSILLQEN